MIEREHRHAVVAAGSTATVRHGSRIAAPHCARLVFRDDDLHFALPPVSKFDELQEATMHFVIPEAGLSAAKNRYPGPMPEHGRLIGGPAHAQVASQTAIYEPPIAGAA